MNWDKFKFGALLVVLSTCVLAAGWGMRLKGSGSQDSEFFKVINYTSEQSSPWASEHPYSVAYDDDDYDHEHSDHHDDDGEDEDDPYDHDHDEHHDPNAPEDEHPSSASYDDDDQDPNVLKGERLENELLSIISYNDQDPNEPENEHSNNEHPSSVTSWYSQE